SLTLHNFQKSVKPSFFLKDLSPHFLDCRWNRGNLFSLHQLNSSNRTSGHTQATANTLLYIDDGNIILDFNSLHRATFIDTNTTTGAFFTRDVCFKTAGFKSVRML